MTSLKRFIAQQRNVPGLERAEERLQALFTPSDWLLASLSIGLLILGAGILFVQASLAVSVEVPRTGGIHREGVVGTPRFINPLIATSEVDRDLTALVYGGLMKHTSDGSVEPYLAKEYQVSEDGLQYTFILNDSIFFHDGSPITAEDVVYTVQAAKNPDIKSPRRANWEGVEVVAVDEKTVTFTLRAPYALFLENTTMGILPQALWKGVSAEEFPFTDLNTNPVGSGLYRVENIKKNSSGVPVSYTLRSAGTGPVRPYITRMVFSFYPNTEELERAYLAREIDAAYSLVPPTERGSVLEEAVFARIFAVFFNQNQQELFANEVVRRALDRALDKRALIATVVNGYGSPLSGPLPPQSVVREEADTLSLDAHRALASELLERDGWERGEDGIYEKTVNKETRRLSFSLATSNVPELKAAAEAVAESWRALGAEVTLQFFDQNDLTLEVLRPRKYDALLFGLVVGRELDLFAFWHSSQRNDPGLNIALYANITTDKLLETARNDLSSEVRRESAARAAEEIAQEVAAVFLYAPHFTYAHTPELRGVTLTSVATPSDRFAGVEAWYLNTERVWNIFAGD